jgi:transposase
MASKRFTDEFKAEAVKQVSERGYPVTEVAERLGVSSHSLYGWLRERGISREVRKAKKSVDLVQENARLRAELRRAEEERDILKKAAALSTGRCNIIGVAADREGKCDDGSTWIVIGAEAGTVDALARRCFVQRDCP